MPGSSDLHPEEVHARRGEVQLLDVREQHEWQAGHVEEALHVPMRQLTTAQDRLANDRTIVCICRSGGRSATVAQALTRAGYDAVNMLGGMQAWAADDLPWVTDSGDDPYLA